MGTFKYQYKKTFIPVQVGIIAVCSILFYRGVPAIGMIVTALVMEVASVAGAWWGARLQRKVMAAQDKLLPVMRR